MEEAKRKEIEARLYELISKTRLNDAEEKPEKRETRGARVIRRRKGKPDVRVV
jgi:hypothetical protein